MSQDRLEAVKETSVECSLCDTIAQYCVVSALSVDDGSRCGNNVCESSISSH